jgi:flagellar basal-body rod protein FlgC
MGYLDSLDVSASALTAQKLWMDTISQNIANMNVTRGEGGKPYKRKIVVLEEKKSQAPFSQYLNGDIKGDISVGAGVRVSKIVDDKTPFRKVYDPGNPDADKDGFLEMPNVDLITEMINMIAASRAYEANVTSMNATKSMALKALEIGRG